MPLPGRFAVILAFIGVKLILQASHKLISTAIPQTPSPISLAVIVVVLAASVVFSLRRTVPSQPALTTPEERPLSRSTLPSKDPGPGGTRAEQDRQSDDPPRPAH